MQFRTHSNLRDKHAFLSPSSYHWMNYDIEKLDATVVAALAAKRGNDLHALAAECIRLGVKLEQNSKTLNSYVNDAIGFRMNPEQTLYYSDNAFGTCDAISFRKNVLRIHDLKTGVTPTSEHQLEVYAALFCLEYEYKPFEIEIELRIYQNDDVRTYIPDGDDLVHIIDTIITFDKRIDEIKKEALL